MTVLNSGSSQFLRPKTGPHDSTMATVVNLTTPMTKRATTTPSACSAVPSLPQGHVQMNCLCELAYRT
jgi:hypothetical protein